MKKTYSILIVITASILFMSCKKCYECTGNIPVFFNDQEVGSTEISQEFCENGPLAKAQKEAYEEEGYICVEQ